MSGSAARMRKLRQKLKANEELYQEMKESEKKRQKMVRDKKKEERVKDDAKLKKYREYEKIGRQNKGSRIRKKKGVRQNMEERPEENREGDKRTK